MHRAGAMRNDLFEHGQTARELSRGAGINYRMLKAESFSKLEAVRREGDERSLSPASNGGASISV